MFGRSTYDEFASYWPTVRDPQDELARVLNALPKHVVTSRPIDSGWGPTHPIGGDLATEVTDLVRRTDGDVLVVGSARLATALVALDLVDVYRLWVHPVVLGSGKRLLPRTRSVIDLRLTNTQVTPSGVVILTYARTRALAGAGRA